MNDAETHHRPPCPGEAAATVGLVGLADRAAVQALVRFMADSKPSTRSSPPQEVEATNASAVAALRSVHRGRLGVVVRRMVVENDVCVSRTADGEVNYVVAIRPKGSRRVSIRCRFWVWTSEYWVALSSLLIGLGLFAALVGGYVAVLLAIRSGHLSAEWSGLAPALMSLVMTMGALAVMIRGVEPKSTLRQLRRWRGSSPEQRAAEEVWHNLRTHSASLTFAAAAPGWQERVVDEFRVMLSSGEMCAVSADRLGFRPPELGIPVGERAHRWTVRRGPERGWLLNATPARLADVRFNADPRRRSLLVTGGALLLVLLMIGWVISMQSSESALAREPVGRVDSPIEGVWWFLSSLSNVSSDLWSAMYPLRPLLAFIGAVAASWVGAWAATRRQATVTEVDRLWDELWDRADRQTGLQADTNGGYQVAHRLGRILKRSGLRRARTARSARGS